MGSTQGVIESNNPDTKNPNKIIIKLSFCNSFDMALDCKNFDWSCPNTLLSSKARTVGG